MLTTLPDLSTTAMLWWPRNWCAMAAMVANETQLLPKSKASSSLQEKASKTLSGVGGGRDAIPETGVDQVRGRYRWV